MSVGAPALEAYGMTEAAHEITSNPLLPGKTEVRFGGKWNRGLR
jgi:hypothetical protein